MADTVDKVTDAVDAGIACGLAGVEGGLNPVADAGCAVAAGNMIAHAKEDEPPADPPPPEIDLPTEPEETTTRSSSTAQDDPPPPPPQ
jgi:hypothetical protein